MGIDKRKAPVQAIALGVMSAALYLLLYLFSEQVLAWSSQGHWYFVVPVSIAFLFSLVHGGFTGHFWELMGIKARPNKK